MEEEHAAHQAWTICSYPRMTSACLEFELVAKPTPARPILGSKTCRADAAPGMRRLPDVMAIWKQLHHELPVAEALLGMSFQEQLGRWTSQS